MSRGIGVGIGTSRRRGGRSGGADVGVGDFGGFGGFAYFAGFGVRPARSGGQRTP